MSNSTTPAVLSVDAAKKNLFLTRDELWKEKVTQASGLYKIIGVISYYWNVRSVTAINDTHTDLVNKVAKLPLAQLNNLAPGSSVTLTNEEAKLNHHNQMVCDKALNAFYKAFKGRCAKLGIDEQKSAEYAVYTQAARQALEKPGTYNAPSGITIYPGPNDLRPQDRSAFDVNIKPMLQKFDKVMYTDMVEGFASKAQNINMQAFAEKSQAMSNLFKTLDGKKIEQKDIEASLRQAALAKHEEHFKTRVLDYAKTDAGSEYDAYKQNVLAKKPQLETDEKRLKALDGPSQDHETALTRISYLAMKAAEDEFVRLRELYKKSLGEKIDLIGPDEKVLEQCSAVANNIQLQSPNLKEAAIAYSAAFAEHNKLLAEQKKLREETVALRNQITNLDASATTAMKLRSDFYTEMQKKVVITEPVKGDTPAVVGNEQELFNAMNTLLVNGNFRK